MIKLNLKDTDRQVLTSNLVAFAANYKSDIEISKNGKFYKIHMIQADVTYNAKNIEEVAGWLYGAVNAIYQLERRSIPKNGNFKTFWQ